MCACRPRFGLKNGNIRGRRTALFFFMFDTLRAWTGLDLSCVGLAVVACFGRGSCTTLLYIASRDRAFRDGEQQ